MKRVFGLLYAAFSAVLLLAQTSRPEHNPRSAGRGLSIKQRISVDVSDVPETAKCQLPKRGLGSDGRFFVCSVDNELT
jgi:hypothetical protein